MLASLERFLPQTTINGKQNLWIVKPGGLSRGRSIRLYKNFAQIKLFCQVNETKQKYWVVQKYIENPKLIRGKKFDFRVWVVVPRWSPLCVLMFNECYLRFGSADYNLTDINNLFSHLTNNSINKNNKNATCDTMWSLTQFKTYLAQQNA